MWEFEIDRSSELRPAHVCDTTVACSRAKEQAFGLRRWCIPLHGVFASALRVVYRRSGINRCPRPPWSAIMAQFTQLHDERLAFTALALCPSTDVVACAGPENTLHILVGCISSRPRRDGIALTQLPSSFEDATASCTTLVDGFGCSGGLYGNV
jgi:hypothetical protein